MRHVFLIGPGGVGKTTMGRLLAPHLGMAFLDLDEEFCCRIGPIRGYLDRYGYASYLRSNSDLFGELLSAQTEPKLFALSSGFLVNETEPAITLANRAAVADAGMPVLLLPSRDFNESLGIVVVRQLNRRLGLERESEAQKFAARFHAYLELGGLQVFCSDLSEKVVMDITKQIANAFRDSTGLAIGDEVMSPICDDMGL